MSLPVVARKDFEDSIRSIAFWALSAIFFLLVGAVAAFFAWAQGQGGIGTLLGGTTTGQGETLIYISLMSTVFKLAIPLIALLLGWKALAGEHESGSIKILLSLPHSRQDVFFGKLVGRTGVLSVSLAVGFVLGAIVLPFLLSGFTVGYYVTFMFVTPLYGLTYVAIAVSISGLTKSTTFASMGMIGVFVLFYIVWNVVGIGLNLLVQLTDYFSQTTVHYQGTTFKRPPDWVLFFNRIDPGAAYQNALTFTLPKQANGQMSLYFPKGHVPFYLTDWFSVIVLIAWAAIPLAFAYLRFEQMDV